MRTLYALTFALLLLAASGCATIVHGSRQDVPIDSDPDGALVTVDGFEMGTTPTVLSLKRGEEHVVTLQREGYREATIRLEKELSFGSAVVGNIFSWGLLGFAVDYANGAAYRLEPEELMATLQAQGMTLAPSDNPDEIRIVLLSIEDVEEATADL